MQPLLARSHSPHRGRLARISSAALLSALMLAGCAALEPDWRETAAEMPVAETSLLQQAQVASEAAPSPRVLEAERLSDPALRAELFPGTGEFFDRGRASQPVEFDEESGEYLLNFENARLRDVVQLILGEMLGRNVLIDAGVDGTVTLQTARPLPESALVGVLEEILRINGAVLVEGEGVVRVTRRGAALRGQVVPRTEATRAGLNVRIIPLQFIGAAEMVKILEPFLGEASLIRADATRNLLMLAGTRRELAQWQETIDIFDVDWLRGMSVGLFTLRHADVREVARELDDLINADGSSPVAGLFRILPVDRLNALLVVTPQPRYLEEARVWVDRLDHSRDMQAGRLHVYRMQHGRATDVARVLSDVFDADVSTRGEDARGQGVSRAAARGFAPGAEPARMRSGDLEPFQLDGGPTTLGTNSGFSSGNPGSGDRDIAGNGRALSAGTRIVADDVNNSLLIYASLADYETIEQALRQLDIPPKQVLIDATIIEVILRDELRYGLQWYFTNSMGSYSGQGILANAPALSRTFPGFNYSIVDSADQVRAVLSALAQDSQLSVLSSPSVMVLDNRSATIRVGDQVPIRSSETTAVTTDTPVTVTDVVYRDTGVSLTVTPRVNAGGMVQLDVLQEVSDVSTTTSSDIDSPTFLQRLIESSVAVQSGETIVLGGLIRESEGVEKSGIPVLHRAPLIGPLFGTTSRSTRRTELLVLLTPRVAEDMRETVAITQEFRDRMRTLSEAERRRSWVLSPNAGTDVQLPEASDEGEAHTGY